LPSVVTCHLYCPFLNCSEPAQKSTFAANLADISNVLQEYDDTSTLSHIDSEQGEKLCMWRPF